MLAPYNPIGDVHARILAESKTLSNGACLIWRDAGQTPALAGLLGAAQQVLGQSTPGSFIYKERIYWLRARIGIAQVEVFDTCTKQIPLAKAMVGTDHALGYVPGRRY